MSVDVSTVVSHPNVCHLQNYNHINTAYGPINRSRGTEIIH